MFYFRQQGPYQRYNYESVKCLCSKMVMLYSWVERIAMQNSAIRIKSFWKKIIHPMMLAQIR